jgi:hypothetical protein
VALPNFNRVRANVKVPTGSRIKYAAGQGYYTEPIPGYKPAVAPSLDSRVNAILDKQFGTSTSLIKTQADQLMAESQARQKNYQDAYAAAALTNKALGADVQKGWEQAGSAVQGLAGALSGGIGAQTQQGVATMDQALANVGAPATQYDPNTQAGVESYYGGYLPGREFAQLGATGRQHMLESGIGLAERGRQESLATQKLTNFEILKNQTAALADIAKARPGAYSDIRGLFATEKQNATTAQIAKAELAARIRQEKRDLHFKYEQLRQDAKTEAERNRLTAEENALDRAIDQQNANTAAWTAKHPAPSKTAYNTGTYQQKLAAVLQDELQNVESTFVYSGKPSGWDDPVNTAKIPVISNSTGRPVMQNGKPKLTTFTNRVWQNNERLRYREHAFAKLWPMIEGNIAKGNREKAKKYLRGRLWKVALSWDPLLNPEGPTEEALPGGLGGPTGTTNRVT